MHYLCARDRIFRLNNQRIARFSIVRIDPYRIYRLIKYREIMKKIIQIIHFIRSLGNNNWNKTRREWNDLKIFERYARNSVHEARFESRFAFAPVAEREEVGHNNIAALYNSNRMRSRNGRANEKLEKVITQRGVFAFCAHYSETPCGEIRSRSCVRARI